MKLIKYKYPTLIACIILITILILIPLCKTPIQVAVKKHYEVSQTFKGSTEYDKLATSIKKQKGKVDNSTIEEQYKALNKLSKDNGDNLDYYQIMDIINQVNQN